VFFPYSSSQGGQFALGTDACNQVIDRTQHGNALVEVLDSSIIRSPVSVPCSSNAAATAWDQIGRRREPITWQAPAAKLR
jgi:hypothetical protein